MSFINVSVSCFPSPCLLPKQFQPRSQSSPRAENEGVFFLLVLESQEQLLPRLPRHDLLISVMSQLGVSAGCWAHAQQKADTGGETSDVPQFVVGC